MQFIILLGTGPWQRSLFELLKYNKFKICTISPVSAFTDSDLHIYKDVRDVSGIMAEIEINGIEPMLFISSQTDLAVNSIAQLNHNYNLNLSNILVAKVFTNKYLMRNLVANLDVSLKNPIYQKVTCASDIDSMLDSHPSLSEDIIIKPTSLQSSLGVRHIKYLRDFDFNAYRSEMSNYSVHEFIIEKNIKGIEYTLEGYKKKNGSHELLAVSRKDKKFGFGVANALHYSPDAFNECVRLKSSLNKLFFDYGFGPTHTEVIKTVEGDFYLVEAAIRGGGSGIPSEIVPSLTGFYPEHQQLNDAGVACELHTVVARHEYVSLVFYEFTTGVALPIEHSELDDNLVRKWSNFKDGEMVGPILDDRSRHGFLIIGSRSEASIKEVLARLSNLNQKVKFHA